MDKINNRDWKSYWSDQELNLDMFFNYLSIEKGLSKNTIQSYKNDFKVFSSYLWSPKNFEENVFPNSNKKKFYLIIKNASSENIRIVYKEISDSLDGACRWRRRKCSPTDG